jgi:hypothetical protein
MEARPALYNTQEIAMARRLRDFGEGYGISGAWVWSIYMAHAEYHHASSYPESKEILC